MALRRDGGASTTSGTRLPHVRDDPSWCTWCRPRALVRGVPGCTSGFGFPDGPLGRVFGCRLLSFLSIQPVLLGLQGIQADGFQRIINLVMQIRDRIARVGDQLAQSIEVLQEDHAQQAADTQDNIDVHQELLQVRLHSAHMPEQGERRAPQACECPSSDAHHRGTAEAAVVNAVHPSLAPVHARAHCPWDHALPNPFAPPARPRRGAGGEGVRRLGLGRCGTRGR
mmetsp:Transcript_78899/g.200819  ORF Transcript_78899/g.200819 Transcript_78899/m.200819 type:complete len:226 (-) Transcript_78899:799-1476(-)